METGAIVGQSQRNSNSLKCIKNLLDCESSEMLFFTIMIDDAKFFNSKQHKRNSRLSIIHMITFLKPRSFTKWEMGLSRRKWSTPIFWEVLLWSLISFTFIILLLVLITVSDEKVWRKMSTFSSCLKNRRVIISLQYIQAERNRREVRRWEHPKMYPPDCILAPRSC